jgi:RNA polymerase sigma-70 factor, ECF subfamily
METQSPDTVDAALDPEQWVDLYGNYLYRYTLNRIDDPDTAQDVVQEALMAAIQSFGRFQGRSTIKTWLVAILKRKIVDHYRRAGKHRNSDDIEMVANHVDRMFTENGHWRVMPNDWNIKPDAVYEQREFMRVLYQCLGKLPARLAEIFMLREIEEMGTPKICETLSITESNCWVMLYRARMQLRACLETNWLSDTQ